MNSDDQTLSKKDFDKSIKELHETLVGGMNQMLETLINHIDKVEGNLSNQIQNLSVGDDKTLDTVQQHQIRITKLEKQRT